MFLLLLSIIYLSFISLGLPDSLLGAAWPAMYGQMNVPISGAGMVSMIIAASTVVSSLMSDRINRRLGTGRVTVFSVAATALALMGFSISRHFWQICLWAVPYGLGAGSVDTSLNNYVALHYTSRHMSWLHCMWGVGASIGPYVMGWALSGRRGWEGGYRTVGLMQIGLTAILVFSLPLWKKRAADENGATAQALGLRGALKIPGVKNMMLAFFCYCALEQTAGLWASSYLTLQMGLTAETAARCASLFYIGITFGRAASGFISIKLNDRQMVRLGLGVVTIGVLLLLLPLGMVSAYAGFPLIGLGCAPIFPALIHATPLYFGADNSQAIIGMEMACAYTGTSLMPPLFGLIANRFGPALLSPFLIVFLLLLFLAHERLARKNCLKPCIRTR